METKKTNIEQTTTFPHELTLKNRSEMKISGVNEVLTATASLISLKSTAGKMVILGEALKINSLDNKNKILEIQGQIIEIKYNQKKKKFLEKMFK